MYMNLTVLTLPTNLPYQFNTLVAHSWADVPHATGRGGGGGSDGSGDIGGRGTEAERLVRSPDRSHCAH